MTGRPGLGECPSYWGRGREVKGKGEEKRGKGGERGKDVEKGEPIEKIGKWNGD